MSDSTYAEPQGSSAQRLLSRRIRQMLALDPQATALTFDGASLPWAYYSTAIADLESLLSVTPGLHRIGIVLRNRPGPLAALVATICTGREVVTLSPQLGDVGLAQDIVELAPDVIVAEDEDWAREPLLSAAEKIRAVAVRSGTDRALAAQPVPWMPAPAVSPPGDIAVLMMTSGTTGRPKRVELTYDRMVSAFSAAGLPLQEWQQPRLSSSTAILWASLVHISGLYFGIAYVLEGRSVALLEKFDVDAWVELVKQHRPRFLRLAPTAIRMVLRADVPADIFEGVSAVGSGTAPLPTELAEEFERRYGVPILGIYGATEFAGAIAGWTLEDKQAWGPSKRGSVGRAHRGVELRIVDRDTGEILAPTEIGLLQARGGQLPGDTGAWLSTTDLASIDKAAHWATASKIETRDLVGTRRGGPNPDAARSLPNSASVRSRASPNIAIICMSIRYIIGFPIAGLGSRIWSTTSSRASEAIAARTTRRIRTQSSSDQSCNTEIKR